MASLRILWERFVKTPPQFDAAKAYRMMMAAHTHLFYRRESFPYITEKFGLLPDSHLSDISEEIEDLRRSYGTIESVMIDFDHYQRYGVGSSSVEHERWLELFMPISVHRKEIESFLKALRPEDIRTAGEGYKRRRLEVERITQTLHYALDQHTETGDQVARFLFVVRAKALSILYLRLNPYPDYKPFDDRYLYPPSHQKG